MPPPNRVIAFGPVPSRRLGRSLGINHVPPKACTYSCVYCQVGITPRPQIEPRRFYGTEPVVKEVAAHLGRLERRGEPVDVLTFVPDGEPTLDVDLGRHLEAVARFGIPTAVITNGSLLDSADVRDRLACADHVSVKVDAADERPWRRINRPHHALDPAAIREGRRRFAASYAGTLGTETMLLGDLSEDEDELAHTADEVAALEPAVAYLALPIRPGASPRARPPDAGTIARAWAIFSERLPRCELLGMDEGVDFAATGDAERDLLATTSVHPMRESQVRALLAREEAGWDVVERLVAQGRLRPGRYRGRTFYVRVPS